MSKRKDITIGNTEFSYCSGFSREIETYTSTPNTAVESNMTIDEAKNLVEFLNQFIEDSVDIQVEYIILEFGKHNGKSTDQIMEEDPGYLIWLRKQSWIDQEIKDHIDSIRHPLKKNYEEFLEAEAMFIDGMLPW